MGFRILFSFFIAISLSLGYIALQSNEVSYFFEEKKLEVQKEADHEKPSHETKADRARELKNEGKFAEAALIYEELIKENPDNVEYLTTLGNLYKKMGRKTEAQKLFRQGLTLDSHNQEAQIALGYSYLESGDLESSEELFQAVLKKDPKNEDALDGIDRISALKRTAKQAKLNKKEQEKLKEDLLVKQEDLPVKQNEDEKVAEGYAYLKAHELEKSQKLFEEVLATNSKNSEALAGLGRVAALRGDQKSAEQYYLKALDINPKSSSALEFLAALKIQQKNIEEAQAIYAKLASLFPNVPYYREALQKIKDRQTVETVVRLENDKIYWLAEQELEELIERCPENIGGYIFLGELYLKTHQFSAAIEVFEEALKIDLCDVNALRGLAEAHLRLSLKQDVAEGEFQYEIHPPFISYATSDHLIISKSLFEQVLDRNPNDIPSLVGLGRIAFICCCYDLAEDYFSEALEIDPNDYGALDRLAALRIRQRRFYTARGIYEDQLAVDSSDDDLIRNYYRMRHLTEPSLTLLGFYAQEDENNPSVLDVARLQNYGGVLSGSYPICEGLKASGNLADQYIILKNLLNHSTIYSLGVQRASLGLTWDYCPNLTIAAGCGLSGWERYHKQNFHVGSGLYVEPYLVATYNNCHHTFIAETLGFSELVARDFTSIRAKLLETRSVGFLYEYDLGKRRALGLEASNGWYNDRVNNLRQQFSTWLQVSPVQYWENFILRYQFEYANFTRPIPDYYTYHNRTTNWLKAEFAKNWCNDNLIGKIGYWHGWQRSFEQGEILSVVPLAQFHYLHRQINYAYSEINGQINECLNTTLTGSYYHDNLHYRTWAVKWALQWNF